MGWDYYPPYVPVAERRAKALRDVQKMARKGMRISPVKIDGRAIASTFWGRAWCDNLESYSDFSNRLPRGRTYARNGSVVHLEIEAGKITALVSGSSLYRITIEISPLAAPSWKTLKAQCGSQIGSLVELLQGRLSKNVMETVTQHESGLFPAPKEIEMSCSCPDWAGMCKHIAAALYAVGNRLDREPELFFKLRKVDHLELIAQAGSPQPRPNTAGRKKIASDQLANVFGIELEAKEEITDSAPPAKPDRREKSALLKERKVGRADAAKPKGARQSDSRRAVHSNSEIQTTKARKRVAQAIKERRKAQRQTKQEKSLATTQPQPDIVGNDAKPKPAQSNGNKTGRRTHR